MQPAHNELDVVNVPDAASLHEIGRKGARTVNLSVQGARGLFAAMLFLFHIVNSGFPTLPILSRGWLQQALRSSEYGVELFFCISGFAISCSLRQRRDIKLFVLDRMIRIYPVLWATLFVLIVLGLGFNKIHGDLSPAALFTSLPAAMLCLPGMLPLPLIHPAAWSLSFEFAFYLAAAATIITLHRGGRQFAWFFATALGAVLVYFYPRGAFFICGILVVQLQGVSPLPARLIASPAGWLIVFLAAWGGVQILSPHHLGTYTLGEFATDGRLILFLVAWIAAFIGFYGLANDIGSLAWALRSRPMLFLGKISYSFYLWQTIILALAKRLLVDSNLSLWAGSSSQFVFLAVSFPPTLAVAAVSQHFLERRLGKWLHARAGAHTVRSQ